MLLVNFSYHTKDLEKFIEENPLRSGTHIMDFASFVPKNSDAVVYYPADLDKDNSIHQTALNDYIQQMADVSRAQDEGSKKKDIRSITYQGLPLYWLTQFSEKHPQNCVLKNVFYFKHLFPRLNSFDRIVIVLPSSGIHFYSTLQKFLLTKGISSGNISFNRKYTASFNSRSYISYIRVFYNKVGLVRKRVRSIKGKGTSGKVKVFTYFPQTWKGDEYGDQILNGIEKYSTAFNMGCSYIPYFFDYNSISGDMNYKKWDHSIFRSFPSKVSTLIFGIRLYRLFKQVENTQYSFHESSFVDNSVIKHEFYDLLHHNMEYLFNYEWLRNYFKGIDAKVKIFYQDEFYIPGRIISAALNNTENKKITSYGVQHGIFYEAHTVYSITDKEIGSTNKNNGLPLPHHFIVWGNYFKKHFSRFNSLKRSFTIVAGYPKYIDIHDQPRPVLDPKEHNRTKILWCTTLKIDTHNQYQKLLKEFLSNNSSVELTVRFHPLANLKDYMINELISKEHLKAITFSEKRSIFEDIVNSDMVFTSSGSTVFLDTMIMGKPILNLVNDDYFMGDLGQKEMETIRNINDLQNSYDKFLNSKFVKPDYSEILDLDREKWRSVLN